MIKHLLFGSNCIGGNTVMSASLHTLAETVWSKSQGHDKSAAWDSEDIAGQEKDML
jgi:hypothetical protein